MTRQGVLYVVFGERAQVAVQASLRSLSKFAPHLETLVVSDREVFGSKTLIRKDLDPGARSYKTGIYGLSPFDQTLFLDADTELRASPRAGFTLLGYVDLVLGQDVRRVFEYNRWPSLLPQEVQATKAELGTGHHMYFNSGVIFFKRNDRVERMMAAWGDEWNRYGRQDQMALLRAIHKHPVRIAAMRSPWNTHVSGEAQFVYHHHRSARREGAPR